MAFCRDDELVVSAGLDHAVRLWDPISGTCVENEKLTPPPFTEWR